MSTFAAWCGFLGTWLLVVGPVYQAALELMEQDTHREQLVALSERIPKKPVSRWWWLLPPVLWVLTRRAAQAHREAVMAEMDAAHIDDLQTFINKATGWLFVGLGGLFIASKETWELCEHYEWSAWVFWGVTALMVYLCLSTAAGLVKRRQDQEERLLARP